MGWIHFVKPILNLFKRNPMFGIDVSHNNGEIDWAKVASNSPNIDFAYLKASEGANTQDNKLVSNVAGCMQNGIKWGAYHFVTWNSMDVVQDAKLEARNFIKTVKAVGKPDLPMVVDVETNKPLSLTTSQVLLYIQTFTAELMAAGYEVAIYSSPGFLDSYLPIGHGLEHFRLWVAHYTNKPEPKKNSWAKWWLWQYTDQGKVAGIKTPVDLNRVNPLL
jgi:lysozyme